MPQCESILALEKLASKLPPVRELAGQIEKVCLHHLSCPERGGCALTKPDIDPYTVAEQLLTRFGATVWSDIFQVASYVRLLAANSHFPPPVLADGEKTGKLIDHSTTPRRVLSETELADLCLRFPGGRDILVREPNFRARLRALALSEAVNEEHATKIMHLLGHEAFDDLDASCSLQTYALCSWTLIELHADPAARWACIDALSVNVLDTYAPILSCFKRRPRELWLPSEGEIGRRLEQAGTNHDVVSQLAYLFGGSRYYLRREDNRLGRNNRVVVDQMINAMADALGMIGRETNPETAKGILASELDGAEHLDDTSPSKVINLLRPRYGRGAGRGATYLDAGDVIARIEQYAQENNRCAPTRTFWGRDLAAVEAVLGRCYTAWLGDVASARGWRRTKTENERLGEALVYSSLTGSGTAQRRLSVDDVPGYNGSVDLEFFPERQDLAARYLFEFDGEGHYEMVARWDLEGARARDRKRHQQVQALNSVGEDVVLVAIHHALLKRSLIDRDQLVECLLLARGAGASFVYLRPKGCEDMREHVGKLKLRQVGGVEMLMN